MDKTIAKEEKKEYTSPKLIEYGDLAEITGSGNIGGTDALAVGSIEV